MRFLLFGCGDSRSRFVPCQAIVPIGRGCASLPGVGGGRACPRLSVRTEPTRGDRMSPMPATAVPAIAPVRINRPAPWSFALVGALAVAVVAGGSVAVTQAVLGHQLDTISNQVDE